MVPAPGLAQLSSPGLALARAINSAMELMLSLGVTMIEFGVEPSSVIGAKSLYGS